MTRTEIQLSNGVTFKVEHNMKLNGNVNSLESALDCWLARTTKFTGKSFVKYINSKTEVSGFEAKLIK